MYIIGNIPNVFNKNNKINQTICLFLPAFQSDTPFHAADHSTNGTNTIGFCAM